MSPIRPEDVARYPGNWKALRRKILGEAQFQCECVAECGLHADHRCAEIHGRAAQFARGKVVLTVAHLDHTPEHCERANLKAMCQRCHLVYDREHHAETRKRTNAASTRSRSATAP